MVTMKPYRAILLDINGTLHIENSPIPEIHTLLYYIQQNYSHRLKIIYVSNTTQHSRSTIIHQLTSYNIPVTTNELYTSLTTTAQLFQSNRLYHPDNRPYLLLTEDAKHEFYSVSGINQTINESLSPDQYNCVVVGLSPESFNYQQLNTAFHILHSNTQKHKLIATHVGRYHKVSDGVNLGPGAFVRALEYSTGITADIIGKPSHTFYTGILHENQLQSCDCVMIGDDIKDDVIGAIKCGMDGILVRTGKYRSEDEYSYDITPTHTYNNVVDAITAIIDAHKQTTSKL